MARPSQYPGEMFFPPNGKLGFAVFLNSVKRWDPPHRDIEIAKHDIDSILEDIRADFAKGSYALEVE
jgi:hypothetical protein